jgi:isoleucyl-tRNA synthetase
VFADSDSVHLNNFPSCDYRNDVGAFAARWDAIKDVRAVVLAAIEPKRTDKTIGSSLEAKADITAPADTFEKIAGVDFAEICIISQFDIKKGESLSVEIVPAPGQKCERCWKILPEVGTDKEYPNLSLRDADAVRYYTQIKKAA